jgi:hypothetical protein
MTNPKGLRSSSIGVNLRVTVVATPLELKGTFLHKKRNGSLAMSDLQNPTPLRLVGHRSSLQKERFPCTA